MSRFYDVVRRRRSIRKFLLKEVPQALIFEVLEAAQWAPSAHNSQCWRFIVIRDSKIRRSLAEGMAEAWVADLKKEGMQYEEEKRVERVERFAAAPVLILACLTMDGLRKFSDVERKNIERDLGVESLAASIENMLLAAHMKGLGTCWFCAPAFAKEAVRKVLNIPSEVEPSALIILGYAAEKPKVPMRKNLKEFCFTDAWGKELAN